jgi:hypothetical protein
MRIENNKMTKAERAELGALIRKRERVLKTAADEHAAKLLARFEEEMDAHYHYDDDAIWAAAYREAEAVCSAAQEEIAKQSKVLGIPAAFAPRIHMGWEDQGRNAIKQERMDMRRIAHAQVAARRAEARTKIERSSLEAQTEIVTSGIESEAARAFLERQPPIESLMPALDLQEVKKLIGHN